MSTELIDVVRMREEGDRYALDWDACHFLKGWAQVDTRQDASYFGIWANPKTMKVVTFCEGDVTIESAKTPEAFAEHVRGMAEHYNTAGHGFKIDGMCRPEIIEAFERMGLGDLLH